MIQTSRIREQMEVFDCDGTLIGTIARVEKKAVKLANGSDARGDFIPLAWIERVEGAVYLNERWAPIEEGSWSRAARQRQLARQEGSAGAADLASQDF